VKFKSFVAGGRFFENYRDGISQETMRRAIGAIIEIIIKLHPLPYGLMNPGKIFVRGASV
jgi:hypothetical protein